MCSAVVLGYDKRLRRKGIKYVCWLRTDVEIRSCMPSYRYDTYALSERPRWKGLAWPPPPPHALPFATPATWSADESHTCRNLSGLWQPAAPGLAQRYESTALVEGEVYDSRAGEFAPLARKSKPWSWQRNNSSPPSLLVFREEEPPSPRVGGLERAAPSTLPTADVIDWSAALRGRVVVFLGDSLGAYQAINLLLLASERRRHSVESVKRSFGSTSGESMHQGSWCRAVCSKLGGPWSRQNRCRQVHFVVCWLSAAKSESPSMLRRSLALVATWLFSFATTLDRRDIVVANYGHHFLPFGRDAPGGTQLAPFVEACKWHAHGRWRPELLDPNDEAAAKAEGGGGTRGLAAAWQRRVPHMLYREANPQMWPGGIFPGRVGTASKKHVCLPVWDSERVQQAEYRRHAH